MIQFFGDIEWVAVILDNPYVLMLITFLSAFLLNAQIPLFSLKFKNFSWEESKLQILFVLFSLIMIAFFVFMAIPIIVLSYIAISLILNTSKK